MERGRHKQVSQSQEASGSEGEATEEWSRPLALVRFRWEHGYTYLRCFRQSTIILQVVRRRFGVDRVKPKVFLERLKGNVSQCLITTEVGMLGLIENKTEVFQAPSVLPSKVRDLRERAKRDLRERPESSRQTLTGRTNERTL